MSLKHFLEKQQKYLLCTEMYQELLLYTQYSSSSATMSAEWYLRLILILDYHLKQFAFAYQMCSTALALTDDNRLPHDARNQIQKRMSKLEKKLNKKAKKNTQIAAQTQPQLTQLTISNEIALENNPIGVGHKSRFFNSENQICSVEQLVMEYFTQEKNYIFVCLQYSCMISYSIQNPNLMNSTCI
jgi:hypothetical protein